MKRFGTTIIFKAHVSKSEAEMALASIAHLLDLPKEKQVPVFAPMQRHRMGPKIVERFEKRPFRTADLVREFEDEHGWPVFYIP